MVTSTNNYNTMNIYSWTVHQLEYGEGLTQWVAYGVGVLLFAVACGFIALIVGFIGHIASMG